MRGVHENIVITVLKEEIEEADLDTYTLKQIRQVSGRRFKTGPKAAAPSAKAQSLAAELTPSTDASTPTKTVATESSTDTAYKSPPRGTSAASEMLSPAKGKGRRWLPFMRSKKPKMGKGLAVVETASAAAGSDSGSSSGGGGGGATVETTPEYERESVEDVMATLVTMESTGDTDDDESSTDESGTKKPTTSAPPSTTSAAEPSPKMNAAEKTADVKNADEKNADENSTEVSAVHSAALKIKDDSASLGRSLGASVRRGMCWKHASPSVAARTVQLRSIENIILVCAAGLCCSRLATNAS
eukprot:m.771778 g.771778  ORF g.771778 m.771778 type:complete len:301 (+) comp23245_c0_seq8:714-1616(+)